MRLFFYQTYQNMHFLPILEALALKHEVIWCVDRQIDAERACMGFVFHTTERVKLQSALSQEEIEKNVLDGHCDDVHFANFTRHNRSAAIIRRLRRRVSFKLGIVSEAIPFGKKSWLSWPWFFYTKGQVRLYRQKIDFVLAMGELGRQQFCKLGFPLQKVFPFCYTVQPAPASAYPSPRISDVHEVVFCGSLRTWKNIDILLMALSKVRNPHWQLRVLGDGPERVRLEALAHNLKIEQKIRWQGFVSNEVARSLIGNADLLVLPSQIEGWGAVVSEALMAGTPVVASDRCGSSVLLDGDSRGMTFRSGDANDLASILEKRFNNKPPTVCERATIQAWSRRIQGPAIGQYLEQVIKCVYHGKPRPAPPWQ
ncbi:glycosyltransferase [Desulforhabdus sp. TSK]|uniref:glycosyltransferase n=1 Tax=Desulforhabdus sp. TSK TaxID=2925014 RepID=UPI001FC80B69|nr:glycosyltransferase [Desulforhabdus sp. TSK]GKT08599.1 hypothetical protein DSTSK_19040 [Desulforhabdus sp. TSK]